MNDNTKTLSMVKSFIEEANKTNSNTDKKAVLKKYPEMKEMLEWVYNPFKQFYITSDNCKKNSFKINLQEIHKDIFNLLEDLASREITGNASIAFVNGFVSQYKEYEDIIWKILDKDLECRIGIKTINSVYPDLIPTFEVALAQKYQDFKGDLFDGSYYSSRKIDGCRCITIINDRGEVSHWSREGKPFETLSVLTEAIQKLGLINTVFDGEICIVDENGIEDFQSIMKLIRRKEFTIPNPKYIIFDWLDLSDFQKGFSEETHSQRNSLLIDYYMNTEMHNSPYFEILEHMKVQSEEQFNTLVKEAEDNGWEGLILRKNAPYKSGRSSDLLKVKSMNDNEFKVTGIEVGPFRVIEEGREKTIETLSAVNIDFKGYTVLVGSGFSIEQRKEFYSDPSKIVGHTITVQYFEMTEDKNGKPSLRFPVFKGIRDIKE